MGFAVAVHRRYSEIEKLALTLTLIETRVRYIIGSEIPLAPISKNGESFFSTVRFFLSSTCTNLLHLFVLIRLLISVFLSKTTVLFSCKNAQEIWVLKITASILQQLWFFFFFK